MISPTFFRAVIGVSYLTPFPPLEQGKQKLSSNVVPQR
jgi:hypothetical protein